MITFDNQISTGIQAFGHCGSPACCQTSAFGANPDSEVLGDGDMAALALGQNLPVPLDPTNVEKVDTSTWDNYPPPQSKDIIEKLFGGSIDGLGILPSLGTMLVGVFLVYTIFSKGKK